MRVKNIFILFAIVSICYSATAQQAKLEISNLAPRVGDEITVSVVYYDENEPNKERDPHFNNVARADIKINKLIQKEGSLWIGPFTFKLGEETLTTDSVQLQVVNKLPVINTVVVRQVNTSNGEYLVVEHMIEKNKKAKKPFIKFKSKKVKNGVKLTKAGAYEKHHKEGLKDYSYKRLIFKINKSASYTGGSIVSTKHFKNLPADITLNNYEIL